MTKYCECGYFKHECECCGEGTVCPVCHLPKYTSGDLNE